MELNDEDLEDINNEIYEWMDTYMQSESIKMSSDNFQQQMIVDITKIFYEYWLDCDICQEDDYDEIEEIIEEFVSIYFYVCNIPEYCNRYNSTLKNVDINHINILSQQIEKIRAIPQAKQKTKEWYLTRYNLITASNIWKSLNSEAQRNSLIYEKCKPFDMKSNYGCNTESTLHWGVKYEPLSILLYEHMFNTKIEDFGIIPHNKYNFIGASPDGINCDLNNPNLYGRMIEVKNIYNREITGIPKIEYWIQTQIQMETCDLDECDFIETRFKEYSENEYYEDIEHEYKGVILHFIQRTNTFQMDASSIVAIHNVNEPVYKYMPIDIATDKETIQLWVDGMKESNKNLVLFSTIYWYLDELSCVLIKRNRLWFEAALPIIKNTWDTIVKERIEGYGHRAAKKREKKEIIPKETLVETETTNNDTITTDSSNTTNKKIKNIPLTNYVCLIKLDSGNSNSIAPTILL